ncbi:MAG: YwiC-like family protein [Acidobacteriia bacterium]|nr:YwiC-like family protein [Terriglobia bacterium]
MADQVSQLGTLPGQRLHGMIVPREHGAWGMLLMPLATGAAVGLMSSVQVLPLVLFTVAALGLFWMRTPVESWLGMSPLRAQSDQERGAVRRAILALASAVALALAGLFWGGQNAYLLLLGAICGVAFAAQAVLKKLGRKTRMAAQVVGSLGLTSTAPAAYYVVTGHLDLTAWALWFANWLFAGDQIHFVQLRIHAARMTNVREKLVRGRGFLVGQAALAAALLVACRFGLLPALALLAFVPVLVRGLLWFFSGPQPLLVRRLGWTELAHAVAFGMLLIFSFGFSR